MQAGQEKTRFDILDGMRGIAAIVVLLRHYFMYIDLKVGISPVFGNVTAAVDIFFILSGFVIAHNYAQKLKDGMPFGAYLYKRVLRLFPLLFISLMLGAMAMFLFIRLGAADLTIKELLFSTAANTFFIPWFHESSVTTTVMEYVRTTNNQVFPSNESLWSLHFEMAASILFLALFFRSTRFLAIVAGLSFTGMVLYGILFTDAEFEFGGNTGTFFGAYPRVIYGFCAGIIIYRIRGCVPARWNERFMSLPYKSLIIYAAMIACFAFPLHIKGLYYLAQILIFAPLVVLAGSLAPPENAADKKLAEYLGWLSYPIYCLHIPVIRLCYYAYERLGLSKDVSFLIVAMVATFLVSIAVTKYLDEPLRRHLARRTTLVKS